MQPAGLGRIAPRRVGRRRGWAASENWEEGRILEAQDKQIVPLHVRGGGRWRGWGSSAAASPLPLPLAGSLSPSAGRSAGLKPAAAPAPPAAPRTTRPRVCAIYKPHMLRGPPAPGLAPRSRGSPQREREPARRAALLDSHSPAHPAHTRSPKPGGAVGEGAADTFPKLPASPHPSPTPERKAKEPERGDKRKDSTLRVRGWELPLPLREVKPLAAHLPRTHPPSHLSLFRLTATFHSSGLIRLAWKVSGERGGGGSRLGASKFRRRRNTQQGCVVWTLGARRGCSSPLLHAPGGFPSPHPHPVPSRPLHLPTSLWAPAARARTRAPHPRAHPPSPASHSLQSSFTKLSDFLSPKGVS